jgi:hypothetical protein
MADPANAICSTAQVKTFLGLTGNTYDTEIEGLIGSVCDDMERWLGTMVRYRGTALREYPEIEESQKIFHLNNKPISSFDSMKIDGIEVDEDTYDIILPASRIISLVGYWPAGHGSINIEYKYGYANLADVPTSLNLAATMAVATEWQMRYNGDMRLGITSKSKGDGNLSYVGGWRNNTSITNIMSAHMHVKGLFG